MLAFFMRTNLRTLNLGDDTLKLRILYLVCLLKRWTKTKTTVWFSFNSYYLDIGIQIQNSCSMCFVHSLIQFQYRIIDLNPKQIRLIAMVAVTKIGNPVYTNDFDRSVNKMKTVKIHKTIKIHDCRSRSVCSSFFSSFFLKTSCFSVQ